MNKEVVCVHYFIPKATNWGFRGTTPSTTHNILSRPGHSTHAVCHEVWRCPLQQGHRLQKKNACVVLERCSDISARLHKPFELTVVPEEVVLLLILVLSCPSLSLLAWWDSRTWSRVCNHFFWWQCQFIQILREHRSDNWQWPGTLGGMAGDALLQVWTQKADTTLFLDFYGMTTTLGHLSSPTDLPCHLSGPEKSRYQIQNTHNEFTVFLWHCLPGIYGSQGLSNCLQVLCVHHSKMDLTFMNLSNRLLYPCVFRRFNILWQRVLPLSCQ